MNDHNEAIAQLSSDETTRQQVIEKLTEVVVSNETSLLITCGSDHIIRSRPMINVNQNFTGELYFLANANDEVARCLRENPRTNISISQPESGIFASIIGSAEVTENKKKAELLWNDRCVRWFGTETPTDEIVVIKVEVEDAGYWEENLSLGHKLAGLFSSLTGGEPNQMDVRHDKVDWTEAGNSSDTPS